ncbi:unnamed protein product [Schistocephalus solidus]|uniref:Glucosamine_iso domain-containing protein n=1 Tax=Schistocephalus solidus TaxID=70667 RepID=A0A183SI01_SCHSO|nr:unnamed protein product [Schistocephalus solidus]
MYFKCRTLEVPFSQVEDIENLNLKFVDDMAIYALRMERGKDDYGDYFCVLNENYVLTKQIAWNGQCRERCAADAVHSCLTGVLLTSYSFTIAIGDVHRVNQEGSASTTTVYLGSLSFTDLHEQNGFKKAAGVKKLITEMATEMEVRRDWSKEALVSDPLTTISHKYLSLVSRIWSPLLLTRNLHRIYAIDCAVDQLGFHYPTGDLLPTPKPQHFRGSDLIPKPPIPFLLPLVWTRAPFVLGIHPREDWRTIIERLADDIYYDCLEVNLVEGHSCNIALTGGRSVFGIELALRNKLKANSAQRPHITLWSASEYFNEGNILNLSKPWSLTDLDLYADRTYRLEDVGSLNLTRAEVCRRYSQRLQAELGGHPINWILLGMGPDGEIAGHGNHSDSSNNLMDPVQCSEKMPPANQPGMTFSWATIVQARNRVIFVVDQAVAHSWKKVAFFRRVVQPSMAYPEDKRLSLVEWLERPVSSPAILHLLDAPVDGPRILFYK